MSQHYTEADLLETYYTQPGESMPVMMHLADCSECAARYERLDRKLRSINACDPSDKPETFWSRQRISVMRRLERRRSPAARIAAAAALALALGGIATWNYVNEKRSTPVAVETQSAIDDTDPWKSDALKDYHAVVEWESWVKTGSL